MELIFLFFADYPILGNEKSLPLYLQNMGHHHCQDHLIRPEGYHYDQILYCTKGSGTLIFENKAIPIPPDTAIFIPAETPHEYYPEEDIWDIHWIVPCGYAAKDILTQFGLTELKTFHLSDTKMLDNVGLRYPHRASGGKSPSHSATAAPASVRCFRHWRRSPLQHPVLSALLA